MFVVAASGNDGKDGCNFSPGSATGAFAVGAVDKNDVMPPWSNFGACTNMYAPGVDVRSTWIAVVPGGAVAPPGWLDFPAVYLSGTSMAAPYVSAVAALIMATNPFTDVRYVTSQLNRMSLNGVIKGLPTGSINRLLNMQNLSYNWYNRNIRFNGNRNVLPSSVQTWDDLLKAASKIAPFKAGTVVNGPPPMPGIATKSESNAVFSVNSVGDKKAKTDDDDENEDGKKDKHDDDTAVVDTTPPPPADGMMVAAPVGDATA
jgi:subtilisin family serine protease